LSLIAYRERSRDEIAEKLKRKHFSLKIINAVLNDLERIDLVNDERFARLWIRSRMHFRPRSARLIALELRRKGLAPAVVEQALREEISPQKEAAVALALAQKRAGFYRHDPPLAARRKMFAYLARRGFSLDLINTVIEEVLSGGCPAD